VDIYQVGEENGLLFLAMELLTGESLETRLGPGFLSADGTAKLWDTTAGTCMNTLALPALNAWNIALSKDAGWPWGATRGRCS
jgi:hypothetical protein